MRHLLLILSLFVSTAHAADIECERPINATRREFTVIEVWPVMRAQTGIKDCPVSGGLEICFTRGEDVIADYNEVCGYRVNNQYECRTRRWQDANRTYLVETTCPSWNVRARLQILANGVGRMTCYTGNRVDRVWRLGQCGG